MLNSILKHDDNEIDISIRQFQMDIEYVLSEVPDYVCTATNTTISPVVIKKAKLSKMDTIQESHFEHEDHSIPTFSLKTMEQRISNASCHNKRKRGLEPSGELVICEIIVDPGQAE